LVGSDNFLHNIFTSCCTAHHSKYVQAILFLLLAVSLP
jgi:hypothetical protein